MRFRVILTAGGLVILTISTSPYIRGLIAAKIDFCHSPSQLEEDMHETSNGLNCWGCLAILVISIFSYNITFSHMGLLWIIHDNVLCLGSQSEDQ